MLDRSQSAPVTLRQAALPELGRHQLPLSSSAAGVPPLQVQPLPPTLAPPPPQLSTELVPPASLQPDTDAQPEAVEADTASNNAATTPPPPHLDEDSPVLAMEEEEAEPCPADPEQVEMECPPEPQPAPGPVASSEVEDVPSLAAALMELHELLVSNTRTQPPDRSSSCSPLETNHMRPEPEAAELEVAGAGPILAEVDQAPELRVQDGHTTERQLPPSQHPDDPEQKVPSKDNVFQSSPRDPPERLTSAEPTRPPAVTSDPSRLQPEHTSLSPLPMTVDSPEGASPGSSSPPPLDSLNTPQLPPPSLIDQFPAEHIQQIQAAGFSAVEAAEALERAHGVVELALLVLLARSITVPT